MGFYSRGFVSLELENFVMANRRRSAEKEAWWRGHVGRQADSGLSVRAYCREYELSEPSFYVWRRELRKRDHEVAASAEIERPPQHRNPRPSARKPPEGGTLTDGPRGASPGRPAFVPVDVVPSVRPAVLQIDLPGGVVIHVPTDVPAGTLERVLRVVTGLNDTSPGPVTAGGAGTPTARECGVSSC